MKEIRVELETTKSVQECASTFQGAVQKGYGVGRKFLAAGASALGRSEGGLEFFEPQDSPFSKLGPSPTWKAGAYVPGNNKLHGATRMAVHIYVVDQGATRLVQLVGPYAMGEKGSTERLLNKIRASF